MHQLSPLARSWRASQRDHQSSFSNPLESIDGACIAFECCIDEPCQIFIGLHVVFCFLRYFNMRSTDKVTYVHVH